ncbi:MAG: integrase [Methanobrevibacter sp.]|nr:integrase [Methanobrevibacter sp.]
MLTNDLLEVFCSDRNIKDSTIKSYRSAVRKYESFNGMSIGSLIDEAIDEEERGVPLKRRAIKRRLVDFRAFLLGSDMSINTAKLYLSKIMTFYRHFEVELPYLNDIGLDEEYLSSYGDLPKKCDIRRACEISSLDFKALILFMSSSGCAKAETLSLTVGDFIKATEDYHSGGAIDDVLHSLENRKDIVPTFYLKRVKTNKFYHAFCSPEATCHIVKSLLSRGSLSLEDKLFDFTDSSLIYNFKKVNDKCGFGFVGRYRLFRSHALRKYHASNIGLSADYIDALQGRARTKVHEAYIKTNPKKLNEIYISAMHNVMVSDEWIEENDVKKEERDIVVENQVINIVINFSLDGMDYEVK